MQSRENHFMKAAMLHSQFETLERPDSEEAIRVPVDSEIDEILAAIQLAVRKRMRPEASWAASRERTAGEPMA